MYRGAGEAVTARLQYKQEDANAVGRMPDGLRMREVEGEGEWIAKDLRTWRVVSGRLPVHHGARGWMALGDEDLWFGAILF